MLTVLMVEDKQDVADSVKELAEEQIPDIKFHVENDFARATERLAELRPDVLILDLFLDASGWTEVPGKMVWNEVWQHRFCPIIVYTAQETAMADQVSREHPFVRVVQKGGNTDSVVIGVVQQFASHVQGIQDVEQRIFQIVQHVLRDVSMHVFQGESNDGVRRDMLVRAARRRIAAVLDHDVIQEDRQLATWEKYIVPPLEPDVMMADLIRERQKDVSDPAGYRVVITPTCDMIRSQGPKVESVLVARCHEWKSFFTVGANLAENTRVSTLRKKLPALLNESYSDGHILLPGYPNLFPSVAVDLRDLELVPFDGIGEATDSETTFVRVASIDSPFREQVAWNYLQVTGRPGTPPCNNDPWKESIIEGWSQS